jgi:hypothetical protein
VSKTLKILTDNGVARSITFDSKFVEYVTDKYSRYSLKFLCLSQSFYWLNSECKQTMLGTILQKTFKRTVGESEMASYHFISKVWYRLRAKCLHTILAFLCLDNKVTRQ